MALLTLDQQIILEGNPRFGVIWFHNIVNAMTIGTDWFVRGLVGVTFLEHFYGSAEKIRDIGIEYIG